MSPVESDDHPTPEMLEMYRQNRCMGISQAQIATEFGITQPTVSKNIAKAERWLRNQYRDEVALFRARSTARLEYLYGEAVRGWESSKLPAIVKMTRIEKGTEISTMRESPSIGNPAFLRVASDTLKLIDAIWADDMKAGDRPGTEIRVAGMTQLQMIEAHIQKLQESRLRITQSTD